jgi:hypothetical protein
MDVPLELVEIVWGEFGPMGSHRFRIPMRFAAWDSAGNGGGVSSPLRCGSVSKDEVALVIDWQAGDMATSTRHAGMRARQTP